MSWNLENNEDEYNHAVRFFERPFTEIGLHCHAFSLTDNDKEQFGLKPGWFNDPGKLGLVLDSGKTRMEKAMNLQDRFVKAYRAGRLDVYPGMMQAVKGARLDTGQFFD